MHYRISPFVRISLAVTVSLTVFALHPQMQIRSDKFRELLSEADLTPDELAALENREVVVKSLRTEDKQEIATVAIVRMSDLPPVGINTFRGSLSQRKADALKAGGKFNDPPTLDDLRSVELDEDTFEELQECRTSDCDIHLTTAMIKRFQTEVDWNSPEHRPVVTRLFLETLVGRVRDYMAEGDAELGQHDNRRQPMDLAATHRRLLADSSFFKALAPEVADYLRDFPNRELPGAESGFHWSIIDFGLKPSVTLSHSVAYERPEPSGPQLFVVSKQFYASRYVDASLTVSMLLRVAGTDHTDTYMIVTDRSRSDALEGPLGGLARKIVRKEAEERLKDLVSRAELRLIAATRPSPPVNGDGQGSAETVAGRVRPPVVLAIVAVLFVVAFLIILRHRWR
jgi:hypothetical protein